VRTQPSRLRVGGEPGETLRLSAAEARSVRGSPTQSCHQGLAAGVWDRASRSPSGLTLMTSQGTTHGRFQRAICDRARIRCAIRVALALSSQVRPRFRSAMMTCEDSCFDPSRSELRPRTSAAAADGLTPRDGSYRQGTARRRYRPFHMGIPAATTEFSVAVPTNRDNRAQVELVTHGRAF
jgi:hypothetical protein